MPLVAGRGVLLGAVDRPDDGGGVERGGDRERRDRDGGVGDRGGDVGLVERDRLHAGRVDSAARRDQRSPAARSPGPVRAHDATTVTRLWSIGFASAVPAGARPGAEVARARASRGRRQGSSSQQTSTCTVKVVLSRSIRHGLAVTPVIAFVLAQRRDDRCPARRRGTGSSSRPRRRGARVRSRSGGRDALRERLFAVSSIASVPSTPTIRTDAATIISTIVNPRS